MVATSCSNAPKQGEKPNVIFILMDDAGYGDFGCYGQTKTETPNIDALANNGIRFTDMYTAAPVSSPSRACLITGQHMGNSQIRENVEGRVEDGIWNFDTVDQNPAIEGQMGLKPGTPTLGTVMQQAGYATGMVGKWGIGSPVGG
ncbi:MAG: sulfatase-like hydrolase/transferase, partial [Alistipes sp.]|nr:sulfatase-like hydrolase/transferase [Alistipes sp.]